MPGIADHSHVQTRATNSEDRLTVAYDAEAAVVTTEREVTAMDAGVEVARAVIIERQCVPTKRYQLPTLIRFVELFDEDFAARVAAVYDVRRGHGDAEGSEAVSLADANGRRWRCLVKPPFTVGGSREDAEFLVADVKEAR